MNNTMIHVLMMQFDDAWNRRDALGLAGLFDPKGVFQFQTGLTLRGREEIEKFYIETLPVTPPEERHHIQVGQVRLVGEDIIIAQIHAEVYTVGPNGERCETLMSVSGKGIGAKKETGWYISAAYLKAI